ncbi:hypothetical protein [Actinophytocola sp.]|uniref:hypothetical protein n=1 Tax=Actinophytocola sp. TaxID=1872138 RepID=UPI002D44D8AF|nr:hypothetical protein [Actinophytocola sp.]HYQ69081.1 hypothetical protein [Actinophytocola sp.]
MLAQAKAAVMWLFMAGVVIGLLSWFVANPTQVADAVVWVIDLGRDVVMAMITTVRSIANSF